MEEHINLIGLWEEEVVEDLDNYVDMIIEYAHESGKTNYIDARLERYEQVSARRNAMIREKEQARKEKKALKYETKLENFIRSQHNRKRENRIALDLATSNYRYDPRYKSCTVIVALCKYEDMEYFAYYAGQEVSTDINDASLFYDDDLKYLSECKRTCMEMEEVLCVSTMRLL
jgi:hypothetical protein